MKRRLRQCLPSIRWVPHDIPTEASSQSQAQSQTQSHRPIFHILSTTSKETKDPNAPKVHRRKSTLSIPSEPDEELDARTNLQSQSIFFAKLPFEIRMMVYEYVMGEETIHLTLGSKARFGHFLCDQEESLECGCRVLVGGRKGYRRFEHWILGSLVVCRRMYTEAIPLLYAPHTFSLLHPTHLLYLPTRLPLPRIDTIRTLRLRWSIRALPYLRRGASKKYAYPEDTSNWQRGWQILANMKSLRDLYVVLIDPTPGSTWESRWLDLEEQLIQDVKAVVKPRWFELMLPYESCDTDWDMGESRVVLRKPYDENETEE
ncbi:hypothetical protein BDV96DRAFT_481341 [Lophiotrema nucula]|uniref:DUF7730 domain-containing protein n=1 Tax=Lophiotrema nucula TaxID=690887 RepID=A0A6A5ZV23_9PLEO|nr:hypothetical protein BDV96DRAFT_481341 [Lophiotrema nucula]